MTEALFSASWYRVAGLTPRLRSHAEIHRHQYRGQTWYVLQDLSTERFHRFSFHAYLVLGLLDGRRTVQEVWDLVSTRLGDDAPTQDEMIHLLAQLHAADVLQCDVPPDTAELLRRYEQRRRRALQTRFLSVFSWRLPLVDPERFLRRALPGIRPLVGWAGGLLWVAVVGTGLVMAAAHWTDLTSNVTDRVLSPQNLLWLWLMFPLVKVLHELGHAAVTKAYGGEVHDLGIMLLVLTPIPYVDASSASAFRNKWQRILVGAAGMLVELFLGSLALLLWLNVEPGTLRALAYNVVFIAGVSTLVFNANPLLRFDGYYILADLLEIPNLRARSTAWLGYVTERYVFGRRQAEPPAATPGERVWFGVFGVASFVYRILVGVAIILFIAMKFFVVGLILAVLAGIVWMVVPVARGAAFVLTAQRLRPVRRRAVAVSAAGAAGLVILLAFLPLPWRSQTEGIVWLPDEGLVRAGTEGFVERFGTRPGDRVARGDLLIVLRDPVLSTQARVLAARVQELEARYREQQPVDLVKAAIMKEELDYAAGALARAREREADLSIRSRAEGTLVIPQAENLPGRFVRRGEVLAYVVNLSTVTVRAVVTQADVDLVRHRTRAVQARLAERVPEVVGGIVKREVPGASEQLPTPALGTSGGGQVAVDPSDAQGVRAMQSLFQFDIELPAGARPVGLGGRVYVRFDHGWEPLLTQWYLRVRQLFLARFNV